MIKILHRNEEERYPHIFKSMFELRADQFQKKRGWHVNVKNGQEYDIFDDLNPLYVMILNQDDKVLASLRLLPTTGQHMLADVFPELMAEDDIIRHPLIWESSRFCIDTDYCRQFLSADGTNAIVRHLLVGALTTAQQAGVTFIVSVTDLLVERLLKKSGCSFERIGQIYTYDGLKTVAGIGPVTNEHIDQISLHSLSNNSIDNNINYELVI